MPRRGRGGGRAHRHRSRSWEPPPQSLRDSSPAEGGSIYDQRRSLPSVVSTPPEGEMPRRGRGGGRAHRHHSRSWEPPAFLSLACATAANGPVECLTLTPAARRLPATRSTAAESAEWPHPDPDSADHSMWSAGERCPAGAEGEAARIATAHAAGSLPLSRCATAPPRGGALGIRRSLPNLSP